MKFNIIYVILLYLPIPFNIFYFANVVFQNSDLSTGFAVDLYIIVSIIYFCTLGFIGIKSIINSFKAYKNNQLEYSINNLMILKYGMIPYFILSFLFVAMMMFLSAIVSLGQILLAMPALVVIVCTIAFFEWILIIPGSFWGIQVIRLSANKGNIGKSKFIHFILQFCFVFDVLDTMYITAIKEKQGRISALIVLIICIMSIVSFFGIGYIFN